jgi:hypothetical protein
MCHHQVSSVKTQMLSFALTPVVSGVKQILSGSATSGAANGYGTSASFNSVWQLCFGSDGALYVADSVNMVIRRLATTGE